MMHASAIEMVRGSSAPMGGIYQRGRALAQPTQKDDAAPLGWDQRSLCAYKETAHRNRQVDTMSSRPRRSQPSGPIDQHIGARIRERRVMLGLSQQQFANRIGLTYQQSNKYELGINRVSAGRLYEIARVLDVPVDYFYEGVGDEKPAQLAPHQRMIFEITRNFVAIENEKHQEVLSQVARILAGR
jgi:transcriptional regulator with XRE-family HTH domain